MDTEKPVSFSGIKPFHLQRDLDICGELTAMRHQPHTLLLAVRTDPAWGTRSKCPPFSVLLPSVVPRLVSRSTLGVKKGTIKWPLNEYIKERSSKTWRTRRGQRKGDHLGWKERIRGGRKQNYCVKKGNWSLRLLNMMQENLSGEI